MKTFKSALAALSLAVATPAFAEDGMMISDAYARIMPGSNAGAAFFMIENHSDVDDRLVGAASDVAMKAELHTHKQTADGTMQMMAIEDGIALPAGGTHALARGGDHLMFMGLKDAPGEALTVTLTFEQAGEITVEIPVDNSR
ncbi:copper chaperone PCu(A)C [Defluviimonas sp. WL0002]|uniref:Copper chaperone PCu(A)C n=1 Tax=Albidovulum marisflavi TaxID=2984159 RepID=A0ABT2ZEX9_9RHOB|nr:copper chaperone PCu(A)C [Defluviimonas sp. WL0002]MCV2869646.1 copper chaperone PCu(A)C [Defluviimonas sp. WL0002]